ncbi:hemolysin family protein [Desulfobaculum bizertense]|uniref:Hemolysin, contains CBS domains n=1 Tax=Desulfobaculum bizertense DSM 18034 TaxID=1121442 RepID=A0A1T4VKS2_9BACT|nr:hemolysin family protein [Desulfobaculum bizertense]UIJ38095.1 hemolysin family protein [Desulfobaculum bizertense]SKA65539.1 Hemolysin, contains CBS domains [Desulfobaculum bizertense DSM 18034]
MLELLLAVGVAVGVSLFCSVSEAALYSVPWSRIEQLRNEGKKSGEMLYELRNNVDKPIAAILTLNTVANTAGAAVAGAAAARVFGVEWLGYFTAVFTLIILVFSEILPKTVGVMYSRTLAPLLARPLTFLVWALSPAIWILGIVSKLVQKPKRKGPAATEEDITALATLSRRAGILKPYEEESIKNILQLDVKTTHEIMTPRTVVSSLPADMTVKEAREEKHCWSHSRIPVFEGDDPEDIVGLVTRREVLLAAAEDLEEKRLADLMHPVQFALETLTLDRLLIKFLETHIHLFIVLDEYGGLAGVVTLEDVLEEILGKEIVDETDEVEDMRELARQRRAQIAGSAKKP